MTPEDVRRHVADALAEIAPEADLATVDPEGPLRTQLDLDSMDFLRTMQGLHRRTGVEIPEADYGRVATLSALVAYVAERAAGGSGAR